MTLQEIFDSIAQEPTYAIIFLLSIPLITGLFAWIADGEHDKSPWKYIFSVLVYLAAIPGIFALTLCIYNFLFLRASFLQVNILVYFLPIVTMFITIYILHRVVHLENIPGFGKLSGLITMIAVIITAMFILDRTHIIAFVSIPVQYLVLIMILLFIMFRFGMKRVFKR